MTYISCFEYFVTKNLKTYVENIYILSLYPFNFVLIYIFFACHKLSTDSEWLYELTY